jgi:hypothetical protein
MTCSRCHRRLTRPIEHAGAIYGPRCAVVVGWVPQHATEAHKPRRVNAFAGPRWRKPDPAQAVLFEASA